VIDWIVMFAGQVFDEFGTPDHAHDVPPTARLARMKAGVLQEAGVGVDPIHLPLT